MDHRTGSIIKIALVVAALLLLSSVLIGYGVYHTFKTRIAPDVPKPPQAAFPPEKTTVSGVDMAEIHSEVFPPICYANGNEEEADRAYDQLLLALKPVPDFHALALQLQDARDLEFSERLNAEDKAILEWNKLLLQKNIPLKLQLPINSRLRQNSLCVLAYAVLAETELKVEADTYRVRLGTREDRSNLVEGYLGHASRASGEAFVTIDITAAEAATRVWPLLDPEDTPPFRGMAHRFRKSVAGELQARLSPESLKVLRETAGARRALVEVRAQVHKRQECGATLNFSTFIPVRGFSDVALARLEDQVERSDCPNLKSAEYDRLEEASELLREYKGLEPALHELTALVSQNVTLHEVRHLMDHEHGLECQKCPSWMGKSTRAELSAYLGTTSTSDAPYSELYGLCSLGKDKDGQHSKAAAFAANHLMDEGCDSVRIPTDLRERSKKLEARLFGRATELSIPESYPKTLKSRYH